MGQQVAFRNVNQTGRFKEVFDFNHLPAGVYFVKVAHGGQSRVVKLVLY